LFNNEDGGNESLRRLAVFLRDQIASYKTEIYVGQAGKQFLKRYKEVCMQKEIEKKMEEKENYIGSFIHIHRILII